LDGKLEAALRHDRLIVMAGLVVVSLACWAWVLAGAGMGMNAFEMTRHSQMDMDMMPKPAWDGAYIVLMFFMWWLMMIAMMLPSATPVILLASALNRKMSPQRRPYGSAASFTAGYLLAWALFSALAVAAQWALQEVQIISGMLRSTSATLSAVLLIAAGAWQFTPWKHACLRHCRGPVAFLAEHRRAGNAGAVLMGAHHGLFCLGCCWFLMALLFVGGVMNLLWIAGLALYVWIEKFLPAGHGVSRAVGILLLAWGVAVLFPALYT
jgi:predicted metal-binding membrane protein